MPERASPLGLAAARLQPRERRTIALGAIVGAVALLLAFGVAPLVRRWGEREALIAAKREQLQRLRGLVAYEGGLAAAVRAREGAAAAGGARLLAGRTPALAASALQSLLQQYADRSGVTVRALDVTGAPDDVGADDAGADGAAAAVPTIPATLDAVGDVYGITELLGLLQHGPRLLEIRELTIQVNPSLRGPSEMLQLSATLRGPYVTE